MVACYRRKSYTRRTKLPPMVNKHNGGRLLGKFKTVSDGTGEITIVVTRSYREVIHTELYLGGRKQMETIGQEYSS